MISFVTDISNLDGYDLIYNKNRFVLFTRMSGSVMNPNLCISKSLYTLPKSELNKSVDIPFLVNLMFSPLNRLSWDVSLKFYEKLEGDEDTSVIRTVMHSPMIMISEREFVDKRAEFIDGGVYYNISTSVPEDVSSSLRVVYSK